MGKQDVVFAGGSEEIHWAMTAMFDAMTALSSKYNDTPETASRAYDKTRAKTPKLMGPFIVPRTMASTASATLAVPFKIKGTNYTMSSACATSGHCIGNSMELIQMGKQDVVFAGGSEEIHWAMTAMFDAMTALSSKYNDTPETASRAYDKTRDGFVIACLLYTSPSPRDQRGSRMPSSA